MNTTTPRAGLTLLEVVISAAVLSLMALTMLAASNPISRTTSESAIAYDMDRAAGKALTQLRREVRQSGYSWNPTTPQLAVTSPASLRFRMRTGAGDSVATAWSQEITYALVPDGLFPGSGLTRYKLQRTQGGLTIDVLHDVKALTFELPTDAETLTISLTLARANPAWTSSTAPPPIMRRYEEQVQFLNHAP